MWRRTDGELQQSEVRYRSVADTVINQRHSFLFVRRPMLAPTMEAPLAQVNKGDIINMSLKPGPLAAELP